MDRGEKISKMLSTGLFLYLLHSLSLSLPRHSVGDTREPFCLQSCIKPLEYALAVHEFGTEHVHTYVGKEPSGVKFNKLSLNEDGENELYTC